MPRQLWQLRVRKLSRPTPTTAAPVGYALYRPGEGIGFDRNGQLLIFKSHGDALERRKTVRWEADIMPIDLVRAR